MEDLWRTPGGRLFAKALTVDTSIYLLGGMTQFEPDASGTCCTSKSATRDLMVMDVTDPMRKWWPLCPFPGPKRWSFTAATEGKYLWMFGGRDQAEPNGPTTRFDEVWRYHIAKGVWERMAPLPPGTQGCDPLTAVLVEDRILLVSFARKVWQLDLRSLRYEELSLLPEEAFIDQFFWLNDQIVGAGGENKLEGPRRRSEWTFIGRFVDRLKTSPD